MNCPDLDENILSWYPYEEEGIICLENKTTDELLTIPITSVRINHTSGYNTGYDCGGCDDDIRISSKAVDFKISVYIRENKIESEYYDIKGISFHKNAIVSKNYTFNNKEYEQVKIFERTEDNSKLIIARNFGIVGFIDENGEEWLLPESNIPQQTKPNIMNVACGKPIN